MVYSRCWLALLVVVFFVLNGAAEAQNFRSLGGLPPQKPGGFSVLPPGQMAQPNGFGAMPSFNAGMTPNMNQQSGLNGGGNLPGMNGGMNMPGLNSPLWPGLNSGALANASQFGMNQNQLNPSLANIQAMSAYNAMAMGGMMNPYMNPYMGNPYMANPYLTNPYLANQFGPALPQALPGWGLGNPGMAPIVGINNMNLNNNFNPLLPGNFPQR